MRERACDITGSRRNKANSVSKSNMHTRKFQFVNLQWRKLWWPEGDKFVRLRISTRTLKTIKKNGLHATAKSNDINLNDFAIVQDTPRGTIPKAPKWRTREVLSVVADPQ
jgi:large subunit ribosomal protein L28